MSKQNALIRRASLRPLSFDYHSNEQEITRGPHGRSISRNYQDRCLYSQDSSLNMDSYEGIFILFVF